jgi:hypothetical protein
MVVGVSPIKRAVRLDLDPGVKTDGIIIIELSLPSAWAWYYRLPYALASHCRRAGRNQHRCQNRSPQNGNSDGFEHAVREAFNSQIESLTILNPSVVSREIFMRIACDLVAPLLAGVCGLHDLMRQVHAAISGAGPRLCCRRLRSRSLELEKMCIWIALAANRSGQERRGKH